MYVPMYIHVCFVQCMYALVFMNMFMYVTHVYFSACMAHVISSFLLQDRLVGLLVKASASRAEDLGFEFCLRWDFSRSSHTSDLKIGTPVDTVPGAGCYRVSAGTGWLCVSIL